MTKYNNRVGKVLNALDKETLAATSVYRASSSDNEDDIPPSQLSIRPKCLRSDAGIMKTGATTIGSSGKSRTTVFV
jgi:hypothetical protein